MRLALLSLVCLVALTMPSCKKGCYTCEYYNKVTPAPNNKPDFISVQCDQTKRGIKNYEKRNTDATYNVNCVE